MSTPASGQAAQPIGDSFHNGVGMAGNKSFCSYRLGTGVPGYTGFVPMEENIDIPTKKGCASRAALTRGDAPHGDGGTICQPKSSFKTDFSLTPAEFAEGTMPNPLWDLKSMRPVGDPPFIRRPPEIERTFNAASTFHDSYDQGLEVHQQEYPANVTHVGQLRPPGARNASGGVVPEPTDAAGEYAPPNPFYTTEYMQKSEEGNLLMASKKARAQSNPSSHPPSHVLGARECALASVRLSATALSHIHQHPTASKEMHSPFAGSRICGTCETRKRRHLAQAFCCCRGPSLRVAALLTLHGTQVHRCCRRGLRPASAPTARSPALR